MLKMDENKRSITYYMKGRQKVCRSWKTFCKKLGIHSLYLDVSL